MADMTIYEVFRDTVRRFGDRSALGRKEKDGYRYLTYAELSDRVRSLRRGLTARGLSKGDRIAILSENRMEWAICDLAAQSLGVVTVPVYSTLPAAQVQYLVSDSAARVLFVSDRKQLAKALEVHPNVRTLEWIVAMEEPSRTLASHPGLADRTRAAVLPFDELLKQGESAAIRDEDLDAQADAIAPDDIATLIYTSGTTGDPKGAMLTHRNLLHTGFAARQIVRLDENDVFLSFLPLCHIIERTGGHYLPLSIGALIVYSDGVFAIASELPDVRPSAFLCVPRLYENMQEKLQEHAARLAPRERRIFDWALGVGMQCAEREAAAQPVGLWLSLQRVAADRLVLGKVRARIGGDRIRFFVSGGAPLNPATGKFFRALGVHILEGYGLTEFPVIALNRPGEERLGTVGPAIPGIEVTIAADGEILARGPSLMRGYFGKPEATADAIDADGWFHTGDIGELGPEGYLRITDRKKDIIVLANGKNVAPQPIEARLKESPFIQEAVLIGDRSSSIVAIIVPAADRLNAWARNQELPQESVEDLVQRPEARRLYKEEIDRLSAELADFERVKRFALVDKPFTIEGGELTPTLKVRRKFIAQKYSSIIEQLVR